MKHETNIMFLQETLPYSLICFAAT
jgi:hypothetical protein